jgi:hypothetical protein
MHPKLACYDALPMGMPERQPHATAGGMGCRARCWVAYLLVAIMVTVTIAENYSLIAATLTMWVAYDAGALVLSPKPLKETLTELVPVNLMCAAVLIMLLVLTWLPLLLR